MSLFFKKYGENILWMVLIIAIYNLWFQTLFDLITTDSLYPYKEFRVFVKNFIYTFFPTLFLFLIDWLIVFKLSKHKKSLVSKILIDFMLSVVGLILINGLFILFMHLFVTRPRVHWPGTLFCSIFIFMGLEMTYYVGRYKKELENKEKVQRMAFQLQYDVLKAQINPHFLFNSLNILYSLISLDTKKSKTFVLALSHMYRYILQQQDNESVPMRKEMEFLEFYVDVLKMRYDNCFEVEITGKEHIEKHNIIPYTMQLLIENVTKHNVISENQPMKVTITITKEGVTVCNPVYPKVSHSPSQIGLNYMQQLYSLYGKVFYTENDGTHFKAFVPFLESAS